MGSDYTFMVLELLASSGDSLSLAEILERTAIPKATLTRLLKKLTGMQYVSRLERGRYVCGAGLFLLATTAINISLISRFRPFLQGLVEQSGLNAEIYNLTPQGAQLLLWQGGMSYFQVRMSPGHHVNSDAHPAMYFYWQRYGLSDSTAWGYFAQSQAVSSGERAAFVRQAAEDNFILENGHILPEISRACSQITATDYVLGLSGLSSEFALDPVGLRELMHKAITEFHEHIL